MKTTHIILAAALAATFAIQAATAEHKLPAPMPEFKTPEQLAKWRIKMVESAGTTNVLAAKQVNSTLTEGASVFYTGKPYIAETGSYAFKFRQYDRELSRWTTSDPSGFPDSANNRRYSNSPTFEFDRQGLTNKHVALIYGWYDSTNQASRTNSSGITWHDSDFHNYVHDLNDVWNNKMNTADQKTGSSTHYLDDGDTMDFGSITDWSQLTSWSSYDKVFVVAHGSLTESEHFVNGVGMNPDSLDGNIVLWGCNPTNGAVDLSLAGGLFYEAADILKE